MKIVGIVSMIAFIVMSCVNLFLWDVRGAQYCIIMAMLWGIFTKLLYMEDK